MLFIAVASIAADAGKGKGGKGGKAGKTDKRSALPDHEVSFKHTRITEF